MAVRQEEARASSFAGGARSISCGSLRSMGFEALMWACFAKTILHFLIGRSARYAMNSLKTWANSEKALHGISALVTSTVVAGFFCATSTTPQSTFQPNSPASESMNLPETSGQSLIFSGVECDGRELPSLALSALRTQAEKGTDGSRHYGWKNQKTYHENWNLCALNSYSFQQKLRITLTLPTSTLKTCKRSHARWPKPTQKDRGTYSSASTSRTSAG